MWRPSDWKNPYDVVGHIGQGGDVRVRIVGKCTDKQINAYEEGADAMYEAMIDEGFYLACPYYKGVKGSIPG